MRQQAITEMSIPDFPTSIQLCLESLVLLIQVVTGWEPDRGGQVRWMSMRRVGRAESEAGQLMMSHRCNSLGRIATEVAWVSRGPYL